MPRVDGDIGAPTHARDAADACGARFASQHRRAEAPPGGHPAQGSSLLSPLSPQTLAMAVSMKATAGVKVFASAQAKPVKAAAAAAPAKKCEPSLPETPRGHAPAPPSHARRRRLARWSGAACAAERADDGGALCLSSPSSVAGVYLASRRLPSLSLPSLSPLTRASHCRDGKLAAAALAASLMVASVRTDDTSEAANLAEPAQPAPRAAPAPRSPPAGAGRAVLPPPRAPGGRGAAAQGGCGRFVDCCLALPVLLQSLTRPFPGARSPRRRSRTTSCRA